MIIAGGSGSGKSHFAILLTERMSDRGFEFCVIDPEGDYAHLDDTVYLGDDRHVAPVEAAVRLVRHPGVNLVMGTLPIDLSGRQRYFRQLLPRLLELQAGTGRPHWVIVAVAHRRPPLPAARPRLGRHPGPARPHPRPR